MVEGVASAFIDEYPLLLRHGRRPTMLRTFLCGGLFLLGLSMVTEVGSYHLNFFLLLRYRKILKYVGQSVYSFVC